MVTVIDGSNNGLVDEEAQAIPSKRATRSRYAQQACDECRRRKVKCCGQYPCSRCLSRDDRCTYSLEKNQAEGRSKSRRIMGSAQTLLLSTSNGPSEILAAMNRAQNGANDCEDNPQHEEDQPMDETDTFDMNYCGQGTVSLRSQLAAVHNSLSIQPPSSISPIMAEKENLVSSRTSEPVTTTGTLVVPPPLRLLELLRIFFEENNPYYPCVPETDFKDRLLELLRTHGFGSENHKLNIRRSESSFAAMLCVILAFSEFLDLASPSASHLRERRHRPGYQWYEQGLAFLTLAKHPRMQNLDVLRFHALETMYMIHIEQLGEASRAIVTAIQLAIRLGLNDEKTWTDCTDSETHARRMLWWSIYYMDRRVSEKCGRPYFMRDTEVSVGNLIPWIHANTPTQSTVVGPQELKHQLEFQATVHLQSNIEWSRMWSEIWDTFFALQAKNLGDRDMIEAMDARLLKTSDALPSTLTWDTDLLLDYISSGEDEHITRFRLLTVTKLSLLRLILRHNPLTDCRDDKATLALCGTIAKDTIDSIVGYMQTFNPVGQLGIFATSYLVVCICHLVPSVTMDLPGLPRQTALQALDAARKLLQQISVHHGAAKRAQKVLADIFDAVKRLSPTTYSSHDNQGTNTTRPQNTHSDTRREQNPDSVDFQSISPWTDDFSVDWTADWLVDAFLWGDGEMPEIT